MKATEWEVFGYFTPSLGLVAPCIPFNYTGLFLTNSFVVPLLLMGCVALAWFFSQRSKRPERGSLEEQEAELQRRSDFYFAFFVCYPSMSQCWFNHFNCRALSTTVSVLMADNGIQCYQDPLWCNAPLRLASTRRYAHTAVSTCPPRTLRLAHTSP